jgi:Rap1a immunity proteins
MRTFLWSAVFLLISGCLVAQDDWKGDGSSLLAKCSLDVRALDGEKLSSADIAEGAFCTGYVSGIHDTDYMVQMLEEHEKITLMKHACPPSNVSTEQAVRVVVKYLRDNPERLHMPAAVLVTDAIRRSFPCK